MKNHTRPLIDHHTWCIAECRVCGKKEKIYNYSDREHAGTFLNKTLVWDMKHRCDPYVSTPTNGEIRTFNRL